MWVFVLCKHKFSVKADYRHCNSPGRREKSQSILLHKLGSVQLLSAASSNILQTRRPILYFCRCRLCSTGDLHMRWEIEISYLEMKSFWTFREYRVRSREGIERLLNLQSLVYSVFSLLPILDSDFAPLDPLNIQERRWHMEQLISQEIIFHRLEERLQTDKNKLTILQQCREITLQDNFTV